MIHKERILTTSTIGEQPLRNKFAVAPMTRITASEEGYASKRQAEYYERFAKGGFGLVITEGIYTDQKYSQGYQFQPGLANVEQAHAWKAVVSCVHKYDSAIFAQLMHAGALSQGNRFSEHTAGPSAVMPKGEQLGFYYGKGNYPVPKAMTDEDIADVIEGFAKSAKRAIEISGFDGVEIHGANGYLLDQFLTDYTNLRTDRWGGDTKKRMQLSLEVIKEVSRAVGSFVPVGIRISQGKVNDYFHKWGGGEQDAEIIFGSLNDAGVDFIHVTEFEAWKPAFSESGPSLVALARKYAPKAKIIANGSLHELDKAHLILESDADIIAFGRGALANPDLPNLVAEQEPLREFDPAILGPIADIKDSELALIKTE